MNRIINFLTDKYLIPEVSLNKQMDCQNKGIKQSAHKKHTNIQDTFEFERT